MRWVFLWLWVLCFIAFNLLLFMAMTPGTPWLMTAFNLAALAVLMLWYYGYFTSGARRYRGFAVAAALFIVIVGADMLLSGIQAWRADSCEVFFSRRRLGLFQELLRLAQSQHLCQPLGIACGALGLALLGTSLYLLWVQLFRLRLKPLV